jgi:dephospho-CoA kinase
VFLVGLTGNFGMGKSTVLPMFEKLGAFTLDTDDIVRSLLTEEEVLKKIREILGGKVFNPDGSLSKEKVSNVIFNNAVLRRSLEDLLHPLVFERINSFLEKTDKKNRIVIVEIPLLFERGYGNRFDRKITVYTTEETASKRLEAKGIDRQESLLRLKSQLPIQEKIKRSDFAIDNDGSIEDTSAQVEKIYNRLLEEVEDADNKRA